MDAGEENSRVKGDRAGAVQGWVTSWEHECQGGEELQSSASSCSGIPGMTDLLGGKKRVLVPVDHRS